MSSLHLTAIVFLVTMFQNTYETYSTLQCSKTRKKHTPPCSQCSSKVTTKQKKFDHVIPTLHSLHWFPIERRITFKLLLTCSKALNNTGPRSLRDLLPLARNKGKGLRSNNDRPLLEDPLTHRAAYGDRSSSAAGPREWNWLRDILRPSPLLFPRSRHMFNTKIACEC